MNENILLDSEGGIATITLNRPEKLNALTRPMWQRLGEVIDELSSDKSLRCIVLRGAGGKAFSPGNDIGEFETERANSVRAKVYGEVIKRTLSLLIDCPIPTVALIEGICVGGGMVISGCCDFRICGPAARFGAPIKSLGITMSHDELAALLRFVGPSIAKEILIEGRVFAAEEALQKGILTRIVADDQVEEEAYATARRIADGAPLVARWHKKFIKQLEDPESLTETDLDESFNCYDTEDFRTGYKAFLAKEKPNFKGQ